jgi:hypothetical protein
MVTRPGRAWRPATRHIVARKIGALDGEAARDERLAFTPDVLRVEAAGEIDGSRTHELRMGGDRAEDEAAAPIVSQNLDGTVDPSQLARKPGNVVVAGGAERVGRRYAEPRR